MSLHASYWEFLLRLLGLMVVVDDKVYQDEVEAFMKAATDLQKSVSPDMIMTRHMAKEWFFVHRDRLKNVVDNMEFDKEIIEITNELRNLPEKQLVVLAMQSIARSDDFYHPKEKMIINKAIKYWNLDSSEVGV